MDSGRANLASNLARNIPNGQAPISESPDMIKQMFVLIQKISSQLDSLMQSQEPEGPAEVPAQEVPIAGR